MLRRLSGCRSRFVGLCSLSVDARRAWTVVKLGRGGVRLDCNLHGNATFLKRRGGYIHRRVHQHQSASRVVLVGVLVHHNRIKIGNKAPAPDTILILPGSWPGRESLAWYI